MKLSSSTTAKVHKKSKSRQFTNTSNNFSQKYIMYTKEKMFASTPKKPQTPKREIFSPRNAKDISQSRKSKYPSPYNSKSQKININMEIKNFNIYGSTNEGPNIKKKKLHKKTISCLNTLGRKDQPQEIKEPKHIKKHQKTKSQESLKVKAC